MVTHAQLVMAEEWLTWGIPHVQRAVAEKREEKKMANKRKELYFSVDIETDGPCPGPNSMLSFGVVALTPEGEELGSYEANLELLPGATPNKSTMEWWKGFPEAWAAHRKDLQDPAEAMKKFNGWVVGICGLDYIPVMVAMPAGFDFLFMYWYMRSLGGNSPFSFSCIDMRTYVMASRKVGYKKTSKKFWPKRWFPNLPHTHVAIEDAREQGLTFINMLKENLGNSES